MMCTDIIAHQMNRTDVFVNCDIYRFEKGHAFPLPLPFITVPVDLARTGVKGGKEIERARPLVLMLHAVRQVVGLGWQGRGRSGPSTTVVTTGLGCHGAYEDLSTRIVVILGDTLVPPPPLRPGEDVVDCVGHNQHEPPQQPP